MSSSKYVANSVNLSNVADALLNWTLRARRAVPQYHAMHPWMCMCALGKMKRHRRWRSMLNNASLLLQEFRLHSTHKCQMPSPLKSSTVKWAFLWWTCCCSHHSNYIDLSLNTWTRPRSFLLTLKHVSLLLWDCTTKHWCFFIESKGKLTYKTLSYDLSTRIYYKKDIN